MDDRELESLLRDLESDRVERKASGADRDKIREAVCAFSNDLPNHREPGVLFVGVNNDGSCANLTISDDLLLQLASIRDEGNILPFASMIVEKRRLNGCEVAVGIIHPCDAPPVHLRGRVWIRVGPRRAIATPEEERRLREKRRAQDVSFDISPVPSATLEDLNVEFFRQEYLPNAVNIEILEQNQRTIEEQLASLIQPTVLGLLVAGKDPRRFLPGAYIQFLRIDGGGLDDPIKDQKEISGTLLDVLKSLDETLLAHISVATEVAGSSIERRHPDYPAEALRQLTRNAVLHRAYDGTNAPVRILWFSDRIEILSPGGPYGQVTRQNFGQPRITDYRNPHLAEAMKNLGFVQRFGVGIPLAKKELASNGNPPPEFDVQDSHVLVVVRKVR
ncbi:MAG: putative DNA binding domain-containing protein [Candidatus Tectomicrobia bacterium]|nr:putative DNA binding domain-containing protein [Candidatus Tectomicrobia bacterium]